MLSEGASFMNKLYMSKSSSGSDFNFGDMNPLEGDHVEKESFAISSSQENKKSTSVTHLNQNVILLRRRAVTHWFAEVLCCEIPPSLTVLLHCMAFSLTGEAQCVFMLRCSSDPTGHKGKLPPISPPNFSLLAPSWEHSCDGCLHSPSTPLRPIPCSFTSAPEIPSHSPPQHSERLRTQ